MIISRQILYKDLLVAYMCARQHKGSKQYVFDYDLHLNDNLMSLCDDLYNRTYKALPSTCFIVTHPKQREVFAAAFRDRIVHHLIFNYTHEMLERTFIYDTYSCIKNRGTHFGVERMAHHIRQCSNNYKHRVWIMKMDVQGYFMHIDRQLLYDITETQLRRMAEHYVRKGSIERWRDRIDLDFVLYLIHNVIMLDPTENCHINGSGRDWKGLPDSKSLFKSHKNCGLPIGNLTSQLFSNVYLNELDQFVKRELGCVHYGRYVDDFYIVSQDKEFLHSIIPEIETFLHDRLHVSINRGKTKIYSSNYGVDFLGSFIKPHRIYLSNQSLKRMRKQVQLLPEKNDEELFCSINSLLGTLIHFKTFNIRNELIKELHHLFAQFATIDEQRCKLVRIPWVMWKSKKNKFEAITINQIHTK